MYIQAKRCDLIFLDSGTFAGNLVKWWTCSIFDHVEICLGDRKVIGARPKHGVQVRDISLLESQKWCVCRPAITLTDKDQEAIVHFTMSQIGRGYDFMGLLGFPLDRSIDNPNKWFCSEFVSKAFNKGNYPLIPRKSPNMVPPELLYQSWRVIPTSSNFLKL